VKEFARRVLRHHGWPSAVLAVALAAAVGVVVVVLVDRDSIPAKTAQRRPCEMPVADRTGVRGPVSAPEGSVLRVVEKGFTTLPGGWLALVAGFDVKMTTAQWWPLDGTAQGSFQPVTVQYQQTKRLPPDANGYFYSVASVLCGAVVRDGTSIIFRDRGGAVAGGRFVQAGNYDTCNPGRRNEDLLLGGVPQGIDDRKTEIYPYCDLVSSHATPASTAPRD
jgi:hypothetical protein